jgi:hypothetical protein
MKQLWPQIGRFTDRNFRPCSSDRDQSSTNILCGRCSDGYMEFGSSCIGIIFPVGSLEILCDSLGRCYRSIECRESRSEMIFFAVVTIFVLVFGLHILAQNPSGLPSIFIYFGKPFHSIPSFFTLPRIFIINHASLISFSLSSSFFSLPASSPPSMPLFALIENSANDNINVTVTSSLVTMVGII